MDALGNVKLQEDYASLKDRYHELEHIVIVNFKRYDEVTKEQLLKYQDMANDVDKSMRIFMTVSDVATYGALVAQIATKML
jgi:phosphoenolpyruvate carboxylase